MVAVCITGDGPWRLRYDAGIFRCVWVALLHPGDIVVADGA